MRIEGILMDVETATMTGSNGPVQYWYGRLNSGSGLQYRCIFSHNISEYDSCIVTLFGDLVDGTMKIENCQIDSNYFDAACDDVDDMDVLESLFVE